MPRHLLLGTAGHIDHGKTTLIRALTGVDTDRLPEEKRRQITIDLGFAPLDLGDYQLGVVDVPGHERFVKNMLAGATAIDLALLVVAADESVKPQTVEHLEILQYLKLRHGVVALTKCDRAEPAWTDLVAEEVRELTADTFLGAAPMVRVSGQTGAGLDELRDVLQSIASQAFDARQRLASSPFRLAIDRVFAAQGFGTVVTGSVASGAAQVGDVLELQPQGMEVRVRGIQCHAHSVERIECGQRAAVNLAGVHHDQIRRGQNLATPGLLRESRLITIELELSPRLAKPLKHRAAVRLHIGSGQTPAKVALIGARELAPGSRGWAQLHLAEPVAVAWGQPLVLRSLSPVVTLGGGQVLDPRATRLRRSTSLALASVAQLASDDSSARQAAVASLAGPRGVAAGDWFALAGVADDASDAASAARDERLTALTFPSGETRWCHVDVVNSLALRLTSALQASHAQTPLQPFVESSRIGQYFASLSDDVFQALIQRCEAQQLIRSDKRGIALISWSPQVNEEQSALVDRLVDVLRAAGTRPLALPGLATEIDADLAQLRAAASLAIDRALLVRIQHDLYIEAEAFAAAQEKLVEQLADGSQLSVSDIRQLLDTSRKIAVPLCEYFDAQGLTRRRGDLRRLATPPQDK